MRAAETTWQTIRDSLSCASRNAHVEDLYSIVVEVMRARTTAEWVVFCDEHDIPCSPIVDLDDVVAAFPLGEHPLAGPYHVIPAGSRFDATPTSVHRAASTIGQDGDDVLAEVGYTADERAALRESGALRSR